MSRTDAVTLGRPTFLCTESVLSNFIAVMPKYEMEMGQECKIFQVESV